MSPPTARGAVREAARADDPIALRSEFLFRGFVRYVHFSAGRRFHGVRILRGALPAAPPDRPLIVFSNHPGWWDPIFYFLLGDRLFSEHTSFGPMEAAALQRYAVMRRLGVFGLEPGPRGAVRFLRTAGRVLSRPRHMLWITAEGKFTDPRTRPVQLRPGVAHLARLAERAVLLPLALEYPFWNESKPEALAAFGEPLYGDPALDVAAWQARLAAALEQTMDRLAAAAMTRDPQHFSSVLEGRTGVGGVYDLVRRVGAWSHGRRFDPRHEP